MVESPPDYKELLQCLNEEAVEYLIVGAYALMKYAEPRFTKDLDIWVSNAAENTPRVWRALARYGAPLEQDGVTPDTLRQADLVYQMGVGSVRIDILMGISGVEFDAAWPNRVSSVLFDVPVHLISRDDLIQNKRATGRPLDFEDIKRLEGRGSK